jgi:hypothetical protein
MQSRTRNLLLAVAVVAVIVAGGAIGAIAVWNSVRSHFTATGCTVGEYTLDTDQAAVASTMVGVVTERRLPHRAAVLVLAAALQESKLENLAPGQGDRDSVGVLQQRPSQGWGNARQLNNVRFATGAFLDALVKIENWQELSVATAVQDVQISADGSAYALHQDEAQVLANALAGVHPAGITCSFNKPTKVASAAIVAAQLKRDLPVIAGPVVGQREVRVPGASWQTAAWFIANADRLGIDQVAYDGKVWTREDGWRSRAAPASAVVATMHNLAN